MRCIDVDDIDCAVLKQVCGFCRVALDDFDHLPNSSVGRVALKNLADAATMFLYCCNVRRLVLLALERIDAIDGGGLFSVLKCLAKNRD